MLSPVQLRQQTTAYLNRESPNMTPRRLFHTAPANVIINDSLPRPPPAAPGPALPAGPPIFDPVEQQARNAIGLFDNGQCIHLGGTWLQCRRLATRTFRAVVTNDIPQDILNNNILTDNDGGRIQRTHQTYMPGFLVLIVFYHAYGFNQRIRRGGWSLETYGEQNVHVHTMFVLPLLHKFIQALDPTAPDTTVQELLEIDLYRREEMFMRKKREWGYWSKERILAKVRNPNRLANGHPSPLPPTERITVTNRHDCKGMEYTYC